METITRAFEAELTVLKGKRAIQAVVNTAAVDRLNTVIDPLGCDVSHFNKTRSVLWQHGLDPIRTTVPIGQGWVKVRKAEGDMIGETTFRGDKFSQDLFDAYEDGSIRGWSIKAGVREHSPPTKAEIRARPDLEGCETIYRKWDLIEYSATPTPGNSDCLTLMVARGLITAPEGFVPTTPERPTKEVRTERYIDSDGSLWRIFEPDGTPVIGFPEPEMAEEFLRAMNTPSTLNQRIAVMVGQMRGIEEERAREVKEYVDLYKWGRI